MCGTLEELKIHVHTFYFPTDGVLHHPRHSLCSGAAPRDAPRAQETDVYSVVKRGE